MFIEICTSMEHIALATYSKILANFCKMSDQLGLILHALYTPRIFQRLLLKYAPINKDNRKS